MDDHNKAIRKILDRQFKEHEVKNVYVDHLEKYDDLPEEKHIAEEVPDIFLEFENGKEKIIEVDTKPMSENDQRQHKAFDRSARAKPYVRSYDHRFASDIL